MTAAVLIGGESAVHCPAVTRRWRPRVRPPSHGARRERQIRSGPRAGLAVTRDAAAATGADELLVAGVVVDVALGPRDAEERDGRVRRVRRVVAGARELQVHLLGGVRDAVVE